MHPVEIISVGSDKIGFFDDLLVGREFSLGSTRISLESALAFAHIFDPFSFHVDEEKARKTMFGGLIVSGLQSLSAIHALSVLGGFLGEDTIVCGAGIDELRFLKPVRPGDTLTVKAVVLELKSPRRADGPGIARLKYLVTSQDNVLVITFIGNHVVRSRANATA